LQVFNVSDPTTTAAAVGTAAAGTTPVGLVIQGHYAYVTNSGTNTLQVFDISNPTSPASIGTVATNAGPWALAVAGRFAYVPNSGTTNMQVFDLGGAYIQQLQAGGAELGTLQVNDNSMFAGDVSIQGGTNIGQSLQVAGSLSVAGDSSIGSVGNIGGANRLFSDDFESGSFGKWGYNTNSGGSTSAISSVQAHSGKYSALYTENGSCCGSSGVNISPSPTVVVRGYFYVTSMGGKSPLFYVYNSTGNAIGWVVADSTASNHLEWQNLITTTTTDTGVVMPLNQWVKIELKVTQGNPTGVTSLWVNDTLTSVNLTSQNNGSTNINTIVFGTEDNRTMTFYADDVAIDTTQTGSSASLSVQDSLHVAGTSSFGSNVVIQNSIGASVLSVNTTDTDLIANSGAEVDTTGWAGKTSGTIAQDGRAAYGNHSFKITTAASLNSGAAYTFPTSLPVGTYTISLSAMMSGTAFGSGNFQFGLTNGSGDNNCTGVPSSSPTTSEWGTYTGTCTISTTAATAFYVKQNEAVAHTFWIDGIQINAGSTPNPYGVGNVSINGLVNSQINVSNSINLSQGSGTVLGALSTSTTGGSLPTGHTYYYRLQPIYNGGPAVAIYTNPNSVTTGAGATNSNTITWTVPNGAIGYRLWRAKDTSPFADAAVWQSVDISGGSTSSYVDTSDANWTGTLLKGSDTPSTTNNGNINLQAGSAVNFEYGGAVGIQEDWATNALHIYNFEGAAIKEAASNFFFTPTTNSSTAFQVQNAAGTGVFTVDTSADTAIISNAAASAGQTLLRINNSSGNSILDVKDLSTNFGSAATAGAFISNMSYLGQEWNKDTHSAATASNINNVGDDGAWAFHGNAAATSTYQTPRGVVNGVARIANGATSGVGGLISLGGTAGTLNGVALKANLPLVQMKIKPGINNATNDIIAGLGDQATAPTANDTLPANGIFFWNNNAAGAWQGVVRSGGANVGTTTCSGTISTTQFATLRIQVEASNSVRFLVDNDASDGINFIDCGTVGVNTNPTVALTPEIYVVHTETTGRTFDVDYIRMWQDDSPSDTSATDTTPNTDQTNQDGLSTAPLTEDGATTTAQQVGIIDFTTATGEDTVIDHNLYVNGTIYADKIKANEIEGLSIFTDQLASLQQKLNEASSTSTNPDGTTTTNTIIQTATTTLNLSDGLTVGGDANFHGNVFFYKLVTFTEKTLFNNDVTFAAHITTDGTAPTYNLEAAAGINTAVASIDGNDNSGSLSVTAGDNPASGKVISVTFAKPYAKAPRVILSATNGQAAGVKYYVQSTATGFAIYVIDPLSSGANLQFNYFVIQ